MSTQPPLELLPFVTPVTDQTLTELDFSLAVDDWNDSLSRILRYNVAAFWKELATNDTLSAFLNSFLGEYAQFKGDRDDNWVLEASEVVRRVLFVYKRAAETIHSQAAQDAILTIPTESSDPSSPLTPASMLLDRSIVSTPVLLDLASIYGRSDPDVVASIINSFLEEIPWLVDDFGVSAKTVVQIIRRVQKKFEKGVHGSKGKGKGKGKSLASGQDDSAFYQGLSQEDVQEALQVSHMLHNIVLALDSIAAASPRLGTELEKQDSLLQCLSGCYNYTLPVLWKMLTENPAGHEPRTVALVQNLRVRTLSIVSNIIVDIDKTFRSGSDPLSDEQKSVLTERICEVIMEIFDQSPVSDTAVPMVDAPMIVDLELQFEIAEKLKSMIVETFEGNNDRLHNMVVMLESLRSLNNATMSYAEDVSLRKTEKLARKLNNMYMNESRGHSASTIFYEPAPQLSPQHPTGSDEDYVKRTMLISQLQDLFPDLGDGFLEACLKTFGDDPEAVTMHLLEENLPADLAVMDRSTSRSVAPSLTSAPISEMALVPVSAPPAEPTDVLSTRRNIFDGDEFDVFGGKNVNRSLMSRKKAVREADDMLEDKSFVVENKDSILQAVENMYDDEYDDTYDSMGINNAGADFRLVDDIDLAKDEQDGRAQPGAAPMRSVDPSVEHEEVLINLFMGDKDVFNRNREARKSKKRQELRQLTQMTDEQLEGWAIMFNRNPRKEDLARKYEFANTFSGNARTLERTEFGADKRKGGRPAFEKPQTANAQGGGPRQGRGSPVPKDGKEREGRSSPRPAGQGSAGTGAGTNKKQGQQNQQAQAQKQQPKQQPSQPKPDSAPSSGNDRAKNERNKASRANHNRRNAHAKKMASMHP